MYLCKSLYHHPNFCQVMSNIPPLRGASIQVPAVQHIEKPPVVYQTFRQEQVEEIQPVVHREHQRTQVRQITQPIVEGIVEPIEVQEKELPAQYRAPVQVGSTYIPQNTAVGSTSHTENSHKVVEKAPIVMDTETTRIIEEVQPVLYKEIIQPSLIRETLPIYETVVEPPVIIQETLPTQYLGVATPINSAACLYHEPADKELLKPEHHFALPTSEVAPK